MRRATCKGFSLVELMVVLAALAGVALLVTKLGKSSANLQSEAAVTRDYGDLVRESHFLLTNSKSCKVSLAGTRFNSNDLTKPISNIELWTSDAKGTRRDKKRFAKSEKNGVLQIDDISLEISKDFSTPLPNGTDSIQGTTAVVKISLVKPKVNSSNPNLVANIEHSVNLTFSTNPTTKTSTIIDCEDISLNAKENAKVWCGTVQNPCGPEQIKAVAIGKFENGKFTGVFEPSEPIGDIKFCHGAINQAATLTPCGSNFIEIAK